MDFNLVDKPTLEKARKDPDFMNKLLESESAIKYIKYVFRTYTQSPVGFMSRHRVEFEDVMQLGSIGLYLGIKDADLDKTPNEIKRYFYLRIMGEIRKLARSNDTNQIVIPQRIREMYGKYLLFHQEFYEKHYRDPRIEEVKEHFNISTDDAYDLVYGMQDTINNEVESQDGLIDLLSDVYQSYLNPVSSVEKTVVRRIILQEKLNKLNLRERKVVDLKFHKGYKNSEIAKKLKVSNASITKYLKAIYSTWGIDYIK